LEYVTELVVTAKGTANCARLNQLDASQGPGVPTFNEFSNVLPEELTGIPPDRDIDSVIELVSDTSPICRRPYRRASK
jgi:hypothetical protein